MNTKKIIREAAYALFESRPFEQVTVEDILTAAGVSRRTFYNHFPDKYALMHDYYQEKIAAFDITNVPPRIDADRWSQLCRSYFSLLTEHMAYYHNVKSTTGADSFWAFVYRYTFDAYREIRLKKTGAPELTEEERITIRAFAAATLQIIRDYVDGKSSLPPEKYALILSSVIPDDYKLY